MSTKLKVILCILITILIIFSYIFLSKEKTYELVDIEKINTDSNFYNIVYEEEEKIWDEDIIGVLKIDKINLSANVKEGCSDEILNKFIGHISETSKYDGNIGLAAHNRLNEYSYFARLNELEKGDIIEYITKFGSRTYIIQKKIVIYDTDWSYLNSTKDNRITMITCIQDVPNQRLCIQAVEI